jgi:hypothetical protein
MTPRIRLIRSLLVGLCLQALTGVTSASANLFSCCRSGPTVAGATSQVPPIQGGLARVWFLRQFEPGESLAAPIISANAAPVGQSLPGTAFLRDFSPGTYTFTVPSFGVDTGQAATVQLAARTQTFLEVQSLQQLGGRRRRPLPARHSLCTGNFGGADP